MKKMICTLMLILAVGVVASSEAQKAEYQSPGALSLEEVRQVEKSLPSLKVGMKREEVFEIIGLKAARRGFTASGPRGDIRVVHYLRDGYNLLLVWDENGMFKRAEVAGEKWRKEQEEKEKN